MDHALRHRLTTLDEDDVRQGALELKPELGLAERMALGSADDIEAALRKIHEWRPLPAELAEALLSAVDLRLFFWGRRLGRAICVRIVRIGPTVCFQ
jgi:hypothetical protein